MKTCPDCGCRVYSMGCVNCNEEDYIAEQEWLTEQEPQYTTRLDEPAQQEKP